MATVWHPRIKGISSKVSDDAVQEWLDQGWVSTNPNPSTNEEPKPSTNESSEPANTSDESPAPAHAAEEPPAEDPPADDAPIVNAETPKEN